MKLAQFRTVDSDLRRLGLALQGNLIDISALAQLAAGSGSDVPGWLLGADSTVDVIARGAEGLEAICDLIAGRTFLTDDRSVFASDRVEFLPAVAAGKILAIGRNYVDHAIEGGAEPPKAPLLFNKLTNALNAHEAPIVLPGISTKVDYEAELAVIIGRRAKQVSEAEALEHVFGYTLINDVTARDLQYGDGQWVRGKGLDTFAPLGPFITTRDEVADVQALNIEGRLNGQVVQSSNTGKMIFPVTYLISYLSQGITLEPGDVIATGTPEGVGYFRDPPVLLQAGDVFEVTIEGLGTLRNPVVA